MAINVSADPIEVSTGFYAVRSYFPYDPTNPALDLLFDCQWDSEDLDIIELETSLVGNWLNISVVADPIEVIGTPHGTLVGGVVIDAEALNVTVSFRSPDILLEVLKKNWFSWSDIGNLDFTIGRGNVAGERPLDWSGWIYGIKKLGKRVVAYGENGVSILKPADKYYGLETVSYVGLHSPRAMTGSDNTHYFIDLNGQMWELGERLTLLDYSEFFLPLGNIVMSYDHKNGIIYICDGTTGYVYSLIEKSLGQGPANVTGVGTRDGTFYVTSPAAIEVPSFEICTDVYDMGTRKFKTIRSIEVGTDLIENMEASIDYRVSNKVAFSNIGWHPVTLEGISYMACRGLEFRFRLRVSNYEYFEIDYIKLNGFVHDYSYTEHSLRSISE